MAENVEAKMTPWEVKGKVNYLAQINHFGTTPIDGKLIERWERVTKKKVHPFIRRGLVFSHQDIEKILDCVEQGIPIFQYTGRGPSSDKMHLGHLIPFKLAKEIQDALNCITVIQLSDDEKFLFKEGSGPADLEKYHKYSYSNARDIIACGFNAEKTLLFSNLETNGGDVYFNNILLMKDTSMNTIKSIYGLGESLPESVLDVLRNDLERTDLEDSVKDEIRATVKKFSGSAASLGQCAWPAFQCAPAYCTSFREMFVNSLKETLRNKGDTLPSHVVASFKKCLKELTTIGASQSIMCIVPMAIDQAPYFRMARDSAATLKCPKPAVIHSEFLPGLKQAHGKMSTTGDNENSTLFLDMSPQEVVKIFKKYAFSGGRETMEEHKKLGGNIKIDIAYQYLTYFLESDEELKVIAEKYTQGLMTSGELKELAADLVAKQISEHQESLGKVTDETVKHFFDKNRTLDIGGCYESKNDETSTDKYTDYDNYGISFDRTFGFKCADE
jgi:tryptophanyl-tRNA synthetase